MDVVHDFTTFILTLLLIVLTALYFYYRRPASFPPGPFILKGIGTSPFMKNPQNHRDLIALVTDWKLRFGNIVGYSTGDHYAVIINDYGLAKDLLVKNGKYVSDRPATDRMKYTNPFYPKKGIMDGNFSDTTWTPLHQAGQMALHKFVEMPPRGRSTNRLEGRLSRHLDSLQAAICPSTIGAQPDIRAAILVTFTQVIYTVLFGGEGKQTKQTRGLDASLNILYSLTPDLLHLRNNKLCKLYDVYKDKFVAKDAYKKLQSFVFGAVGEHQTREKKVQLESHDFLNYYVREYERVAGKDKGDSRAIQVSNEILEHGPDPLCSTVEWVLFHMVDHPELQVKIQEELRTVVGNKRHPKLKDRSSLGLIDAVISESLRLAPPFPVGLARCTSSKVQVDKYVLPRNAMVILDVWNIHRDRKLWEEPEKFNPSRFINASGRYVNRPEMIAFGIGRRICIGEQAARQTLFLVVANLLHKFTFQLQEGGTLPELLSNDEGGATLRPPKVAMKIESRL